MEHVAYRKQAHSIYYNQYHLVFVTKYRRKIFKNNLAAYLKAVFKNISQSNPDLEILEMNTDEDHIHLLMVIPPKYAVSDIVRLLKANSARIMKNKFPFLRNMYEHDNLGMWSEGYFVSTVGVNRNTIERYIQQQGKEDKGQTKFVWI
ncbi:IS200/IS605 family transposase [Patescibacteria group bacterium]|nr:IS200/IS605 family transposase [Patescibacteria group bacterium]